MEPLSYTQSILDWHVVGHMTIAKKHASELDIPEMYVAPEPKDGKNAILANWKCLVKYDISMRENLWIYVCFVCYTKVWVCAMSKAWGEASLTWSPQHDFPFTHGCRGSHNSPYPCPATFYLSDFEKCTEIQGLNQMTWDPFQLKYFMMTE